MWNKFNIKWDVSQLQNETTNSTQNFSIWDRFKKEPIFMTIFLWLLVNWLYDIIKFIFTIN